MSATIPELHAHFTASTPAQAIDRAAQFYRQGKVADAQRAAETVLLEHPTHFGALHLLGVIGIQQKRYAEAVELLERALEQRPDGMSALLKLASALSVLNRHEEVIQVCNRIVAIQPGHVTAMHKRANSLWKLKRHQEAIAVYDRLLDLRPDSPEVLNNRGLSLMEIDRYDEAIANIDQALTLRPHFAAALGNRGMALKALNRYEEAIASYESALAINSDDVQIQINDCLARLCAGDWETGWGKLEWRWKKKDNMANAKRDFTQPLWLGQEDLANKTILLYAEQGFGDTIQFVRYASLVAQKAAKVILEVQAPLKPLIATLGGVSCLLAKGETIPSFDLQCPLMSLPLAFGTKRSTVPADSPYLFASEKRIQQWKPRVAEARAAKVGIVWSGNSLHTRRFNRRRLPVEKLDSLLSLPGVDWYSLQKDLTPGEAALLARKSRIVHLGDELRDFADTAAIMSLLDVLISVDTSSAHFAGALNRPAWVLLPFSPDWRWLPNSTESLWYPSLRLFRQPKIADWDSVVETIRQELVKLANNGRPPGNAGEAVKV